MNKLYFTDIDTSDLKDISPHKKDTDPAQIMSNTQNFCTLQKIIVVAFIVYDSGQGHTPTGDFLSLFSNFS